MPIFQDKQLKQLIESKLFVREAACKPKLFSNLSSREFDLRNVRGTPF